MTSDPIQTRRMRSGLVVTAVVLTICALVVTVARMNPLPPRTVLIATGPAGSAYADTARRYQEFLGRNGVRLELRATNGGVDNIKLLQDAESGVMVALAQGGLSNPTQSPDIVSLGTVFYEPVWVFLRGERLPQPGTQGFTGRVSIGQPGSGTRALAEELLPALGQDLSRIEIVDMTPGDAGDALLRSELDVVVMVSSWEAPIVRRLLTTPGITTVPAQRADAQVALRPYLSKLILPRGVANLATDRPPADVQLIATKASLLVRKDLHPAIQDLLLEAASEVNGAPAIFNHGGQFPTAEPMDFPLSESARQYYHSGRPFLQRHLPFWLASLVTQLLVLLIPIVGVAYPMFRLLPALYGWSMRRRIFRLYGELKFLEAELEAKGLAQVGPQLSARLDQLEQRADHMRVPSAFAHMLYTLRLHIDMVRARIAKRNGEGSGDS
jgi:TRAP-type uncharacterized transport system substrate-binding protein